MKPKQSKTSWETFSGQAFSYSFVSAVTAHRAKQISLLAYFFFFFFFLSSIAAIFSLSFFHLHPVGAGLKKEWKRLTNSLSTGQSTLRGRSANSENRENRGVLCLSIQGQLYETVVFGEATNLLVYLTLTHKVDATYHQVSSRPPVCKLIRINTHIAAFTKGRGQN